MCCLYTPSKRSSRQDQILTYFWPHPTGSAGATVTAAHTACEYTATSQHLLTSATLLTSAPLQVIKAFPGELDPSRRYVFTYSPHGLLPAGAAYLMNLPSWRALFPGVHPICLTADVIHCVPVLRDLCAWSGIRQVRVASTPWSLPRAPR